MGYLKQEKNSSKQDKEKLEKTFGSISDMTRQAAVFIVDILKEHIALAEARIEYSNLCHG